MGDLVPQRYWFCCFKNKYKAIFLHEVDRSHELTDFTNFTNLHVDSTYYKKRLSTRKLVKFVKFVNSWLGFDLISLEKRVVSI